jgi:hypothetical protein
VYRSPGFLVCFFFLIASLCEIDAILIELLQIAVDYKIEKRYYQKITKIFITTPDSIYFQRDLVFGDNTISILNEFPIK